MFTRRRFVQVLGYSLGGLTLGVEAREECGPLLPSSWGPVRRCAAEIPVESVLAVTDAQHQSQWCWAACISMIFRYYGRPVSQRRIVSEVYGTPADMPAGSGWVIAKMLNREWKDDNGNKFTSTVTRAYDFDARVGNLTNDWMINELRNERPFVMGARTHAMVVTRIVYDIGQYGPAVRDVGVIDPWPGVGLRSLDEDEKVIVPARGSFRFAATVTVT